MDATPATPATITPPGGGIVAEQPPPVMVVNQQQAAAGGGHGSMGAVIGVVVAIAMIGIIAGMIGRLCSGRTIMGYGGHFDVESWVETKCSSCVDGHVGPPQPRRPHVMMVPPAWDAGGGGGGRGGAGAGNGTTAAGPFPVGGVPMTRGIKTDSAVAQEEGEEERESSDEEQLRHRRRHSRREEEEQYEHPKIHENDDQHHHDHDDDIRTAPS